MLSFTLKTGFDPSLEWISLQFVPQILTNIGLGWIAILIIFIFAFLGQASLIKSIENATIGDFCAFLGGIFAPIIPVLGIGLIIAGYVLP